MASGSKCFRKCADLCERFLTPGDTHNLCVLCLGEEHARSALEGAGCAICERFSMRTLRSHLSLFSREEGQSSAAIGRSLAAMVATEGHLWVNLAGIGEKEKAFLLDAPVSPSERFRTSVETVVGKFR